MAKTEIARGLWKSQILDFKTSVRTR